MSASDYQFGSREAVEREQRQEFRLTGRTHVMLEMESADPGSSQPARYLTCYSRDLSATGIRISARESLTPGALLCATVALPGSEGESFRLMVEVIWCRQGSDQSYHAGLHVLNSDDTGVLDWLEVVARAMDDD
jgi:hypothetical protein